MIVVDAVSYEYPRVRALSDVSFSLNPGAIAALIGPNGAGKTTLLRCLAALEPPYSGRVTIDGLDTVDHPREVHRRIGYLSDFFGVYVDLAVRQCLHYAARAGGVPARDVETAVARAADRVGLTDRLGDGAGTLSRGLRQRLGIAQAIIHDPKVLLLDEPASGLDPEARHSLSVLLRTLRDEGMTLMVSSHILSELEDYATEVIFIRDGTVARHDPVGGAPSDQVRLRIDLAEPSDGLAAVLASMPAIQVEDMDETGGTVLCAPDSETRQMILEKLVAAGLPISGFGEARERLQDSYLSFVEDMDRAGTSSVKRGPDQP